MNENTAKRSIFCFHCHEPLAGSALVARIGSRSEPVCCAGCLAVAELIADGGLSDFYERRTAASPRPAESNIAHESWSAYIQPDVIEQFVHRGSHSDSVDLLIENLRCSACGWLIERTVGSLPDVCRVDVNAALGRAHIEWRAGTARLEAVLRSIAQLGYAPHPLTEETTERVHRTERNVMLKRLLVATFGMMQVMMFAVADYSAALNGETIDPALASYFRIVSLLVSLPVMLYAARPFLMNAWASLKARAIGMDLPVSAALLLAFVASTWNTFTHRGEVYFDSITMFVFFLTLTRFIELSVRHRTNSVADALATHLPSTAQRVNPDGIETIATSQLRVGDRVLVSSGAIVPADGTIIQGKTSMDESLLTGESQPVARSCGDLVMSGSLNTGSPIHMEVTAIGANSTLSGIATLLRRAQTQKPRSLRVSDRAAAIFLRIVLVASLAVCIGWLIVDPSRAFSATLAVLVVACPCAFSIAMPAALAASTARLARHGVLITNPDALERLATVDRAIFDKTGTLTRGEVRLATYSVTGSHSRSECLAIAATLEQASEHPIAAAFRDIPDFGMARSSVETHAGFGVEGVVDGRRYRIGVAGFVAELRGQHVRNGDDTDSSAIVLGDEHGELARFELSDMLRDDSRAAVERLNALGIESEILSGDGHGAVAAIARRCGITSFFARRTPVQKVARVHDLQSQGTSIVMIGDGINDAPVLGAADVSIAMGRGAALALAAADFIFVSDRPSALADVIRTARRTVAIARQNLVWSATYNFCALPLAALGWISPWLAAIGMSASSIFVLLNALRLLPRSDRPAAGSVTVPIDTRSTLPTAV